MQNEFNSGYQYRGMRCVAFDSKEFKRVPQSWKGDRNNYEGGFFTHLGVGVAIDDPEIFTEAYLEATRKLAESFSIENPRLLYSYSTLGDEFDRSRTIAFAQELVNAVSAHVSSLHFYYVILPPKTIPEVTVGGNRCPEQSVKTEDFLRHLGPMFSYISAWNYQKYHREDKCKLLIDSFRSKETIAWRELTKASDIHIIPHGDDVNPLISFADIVAFMTDVKLYNAEPRNRTLNSQNLKIAWKGVFEVDSSAIDERTLSKIKWINDDLIDFGKYVQKPTLFFMSDELKTEGINKEVFPKDITTPVMKKSKRLMEMQPVKEAIEYAVLNKCTFQFFDPNIDSKSIHDGDILVYMGDNSKKLAGYYDDGFDIKIYKAKEIRKLIKRFV